MGEEPPGGTTNAVRSPMVRKAEERVGHDARRSAVSGDVVDRRRSADRSGGGAVRRRSRGRRDGRKRGGMARRASVGIGGDWSGGGISPSRQVSSSHDVRLEGGRSVDRRRLRSDPSPRHRSILRRGIPVGHCPRVIRGGFPRVVSGLCSHEADRSRGTHVGGYYDGIPMHRRIRCRSEEGAEEDGDDSIRQERLVGIGGGGKSVGTPQHQDCESAEALGGDVPRASVAAFGSERRRRTGSGRTFDGEDPPRDQRGSSLRRRRGPSVPSSSRRLPPGRTIQIPPSGRLRLCAYHSLRTSHVRECDSALQGRGGEEGGEDGADDERRTGSPNVEGIVGEVRVGFLRRFERSRRGGRRGVQRGIAGVLPRRSILSRERGECGGGGCCGCGCGCSNGGARGP
mmetsp:Transcript_35667/g.106434  ORF Transcript_35667/g.106434 Transcript_35667/m.106434 type:complete len:399 (-) Transcript_35667:855-2051(-)